MAGALQDYFRKASKAPGEHSVPERAEVDARAGHVLAVVAAA